MKQKSTTSSGSDLERVRVKFEEWRRTRIRGSRIPEDLWGEAIKLAGVYPLAQICQSLKVEFNHLKRRVENHRAPVVSCTSAGPRFIEMGPSRTMTELECTIEVQRCDGSRMRMSLRGAMEEHLIEMAKAFWSQP